jgi:hypothetical protein
MRSQTCVNQSSSLLLTTVLPDRIDVTISIMEVTQQLPWLPSDSGNERQVKCIARRMRGAVSFYMLCMSFLLERCAARATVHQCAMHNLGGKLQTPPTIFLQLLSALVVLRFASSLTTWVLDRAFRTCLILWISATTPLHLIRLCQMRITMVAKAVCYVILN